MFFGEIIHFSAKIAGDVLTVVFQSKLLKREIAINEVLQLNRSGAHHFSVFLPDHS